MTALVVPFQPAAPFSFSSRGLSLLELGGERASKRGRNGFFQRLEVAEKHAQTFVAGIGPHDDLGRISQR